VKKNILKIQNEVLQVAATRREQKLPYYCVAIELQKDILNIHSHIFGEHKRCEERGRSYKDNRYTNEKNYVPFLRLYGLYQKI